MGDYGALHRGIGPSGEEVFALVIAPALAERPRFADELGAAAGASAGFSHPRAAATRRVGHDTSGRLVAIGDAIAEPTSLASALGAGGRPPAGVAMAISRELAEGLAAAERWGLVHGALHPRSVFINREGRVVVADFAVGRALAETAAAEDAALAEGLQPYVAPEVALAGPPSPAVDIYGLGAVLFEVWAGRPPPGEAAGPEAIRKIVGRALEDDPTARFGSAGAVEEALAAAARESGVLAAPPWQVAAWVREHVEARVRGAEAHLRPGRWRRGVPEPVANPRGEELSRAALAARPRQGAGAAKTPTPIAEAVEGSTIPGSAEEALGRVDAALEAYAPEPEAEVADRSEPRRGGRPSLRVGEIAALAVALVALIAVLWALFGLADGGRAEPEGETGSVFGRAPEAS